MDKAFALSYSILMHKQRGFTLVELSIVLVIIGLLVGGVLTGQSLIRAAELRSVTSQFQRYQAAVNTFRDKYFALPGDMPNAASYWGAADGAGGTTAGCITTASTTAATCNGNGDGQILVSTSSNEYFRFWQHLANAGLIEGNYDGITHGSTTFSATNVNTAVGRISSSLWFVQYAGTLTSNGGAFDGQYGNTFLVGGVYANNFPITPIFKPEEAYNIDVKLDDGKPATGKVVIYGIAGFTGTGCTDATSSATMTANYLLSNTALACDVYFRQQF